METGARKISGIVILSKDEKVLMLLSSPYGVYTNTWLTPGGGLETGETPEAAALREVREETGLDLAQYSLQFLGTSEGVSEKILKETGEKIQRHMFFYNFKIHIHDKNSAEISVTISNEHPTFKWFSFDELSAVPLSPPARELFIKMGILKVK